MLGNAGGTTGSLVALTILPIPGLDPSAGQGARLSATFEGVAHDKVYLRLVVDNEDQEGKHAV